MVRYLFLFILSCVFYSCANQVAPTGGDKDVTPPKPLKVEPENYSTGFHSKDISISFDEYIQLKDVTTQLIVSPPLKHPLVTKVKSKQLLIHIDDTLQANTTYTLNFGNAIIDLHEGNPIENFQYVFSTGDVIDSLTVSGKIQNAFDRKTEKGIYVMLYHPVSDSIEVDSLPLKELPDYFAKTNDSGVFEIRNVSPGRYKLFGLKDNNSNYLYDNKDELIAFSDSLIEAGSGGIQMNIFKENPKQQLIRASGEEPGKAVIVYSRPLITPLITFNSDTSANQIYAIDYTPRKDSVTIWYRNQKSDSLSFVLLHEDGIDTVSVRLRKNEGKAKQLVASGLFTQYVSGRENNLELNEPIILNFNHPVEKYSLENISVKEDSVPVKDLKFSFLDSLKMRLQIAGRKTWKEKALYQIDIPASTFTDIFDNKNDTLKLFFRTKEITNYGTLTLNLSPFPKGRAGGGTGWIIQMVDDKENVYRSNTIQSDTTIVYEYLLPAVYRFKLIEDRNVNGQWDTGDYLHHIQPEKVEYYQEAITVRANWDVEVKWQRR